MYDINENPELAKKDHIDVDEYARTHARGEFKPLSSYALDYIEECANSVAHFVLSCALWALAMYLLSAGIMWPFWCLGLFGFLMFWTI